MFVKMVQCAIDLLENFVNCEAQHDDDYWSGDDTIPHNYYFQILLSSGLSMSFHKIHSKQIVCNPIPKFTQCTAVVCFVSSFSLSISIPIFFSMWKPFTTLSSQQYIHQFFTNLRGVRISALYLILNGTKEEHLNMLEGGIIAKLLDEKWSTFAKVVSSTWHWNRDK